MNEKLGDAASASNILDLATYRFRRTKKTHNILYASEEGKWTHMLSTFAEIGVEEVCALDAFQGALANGRPSVLFVESSLTWCDPLDLTSFVHELEIPVVMLCHRQASKQTIRKAYAAGVSDMLFDPFCRDELEETMDVLLKFQRQVSQSR